IPHHRLVIRDIGANRVVQLTNLVAPSDLRFSSIGMHESGVLRRVTVSHKIRYFEIEQHISVALFIIIICKGYAILQETCVKTKVTGFGGYPGYIADIIRLLRRGYTGHDLSIINEQGITEIHYSLVRIVTNTFISQGTPGTSEFEEGETIQV